MSNTEQDSDHSRHKEGAEGRIKTDQADRQSLRDSRVVCIALLDYASHPDGALMNIVTGKISHIDVNADNAVSLGHRAMENFKGGRPDSIYILPSRLASCHNGCEEEPHVRLQERVYDNERSCHWSTCKLTRDQPQ